MKRSSLGAGLALLLVFAAGVAGGVALERTWLGPETADRAKGDGHDDYRKPVIERFSEELELTDDQQARIDTIIADLREEMKAMWAEARPRYRAMVDSAKARIEAVLDEEQVERYRELLEREAERHDRRWGPDSAAARDSAAAADTADAAEGGRGSGSGPASGGGPGSGAGERP